MQGELQAFQDAARALGAACADVIAASGKLQDYVRDNEGKVADLDKKIDRVRALQQQEEKLTESIEQKTKQLADLNSKLAKIKGSIVTE